MSKIINILLVYAIAFGLSACKNEPVKEVEKKPLFDERCHFPDSEKLAPGWVCHEQVEGLPVSAMGSYHKTAAGSQFMTDQAVAAARVGIAAQAKIYVKAMVKAHLETTGVGTSETVDAAASSTTMQITDSTLEGSRIIKSVYGPDGTVYVLVGMDPAITTKMVEKSVSSSMGNDKALWQKFLAGKAQDEMAAEIAKQKLEPAPKP